MKDVVVIGGGPSGMAAAVKLAEKGYDVALIERKEELGGILDQCIHDGFGTKIFGKALSGPEFAGHFVDEVNKLGVEVHLNTYVKYVKAEGDLKELVTVSPRGVEGIKARSIVYAIGCRERHPFEIKVGGTRPAGVYTAGMVQRLVNLYGILPGKRILIVGGGDVGMIVARHLYLEGTGSILIVFPEEFFAGLPRNVQQCILDFEIPFRPRTIVREIVGKERVEGAILMRVDENWRPIPGTEEFYPCDTVIFSVGLVPYSEKMGKIGAEIDPRTRGPVVNEFFESTVRGVFAAGNLVQIFDYVDDAVESAYIAADGVEKYLAGEERLDNPVPFKPGSNVRTLTPHRLEWEDERPVVAFLRPAIEGRAWIVIRDEKGQVLRKEFRQYVRPSTLERIEVPREAIEGAEEVYVDVAGI
ncbi:FAD-dependent pyridine nucleotide-disulfide oxidoreductase [Thermococcus guaymasensis DSM 11113]|uniref:FAD-dependent pyridine nucleotide-disulfide oxidoreductase n=1 Tax=Thermococcus guaymasensis DSM 11113 TaxID=1432656 RepID=A0A0X1KM35_9EURY|nr:NAD(P)/FAD-dependent oxidoreductase [Thermococcus guaymasensis]AJC72295.1 FAD-dependent pyridine nucleotide-disulfide oxidoreductase [Thermococcus guaymasensis DSM 11113]